MTATRWGSPERFVDRGQSISRAFFERLADSFIDHARDTGSFRKALFLAFDSVGIDIEPMRAAVPTIMVRIDGDAGDRLPRAAAEADFLDSFGFHPFVSARRTLRDDLFQLARSVGWAHWASARHDAVVPPKGGVSSLTEAGRVAMQPASSFALDEGSGP